MTYSACSRFIATSVYLVWSTSTSAGQAAVSAQRRCTIDLIAADDDDDDDDAMFWCAVVVC